MCPQVPRVGTPWADDGTSSATCIVVRKLIEEIMTRFCSVFTQRAHAGTRPPRLASCLSLHTPPRAATVRPCDGVCRCSMKQRWRERLLLPGTWMVVKTCSFHVSTHTLQLQPTTASAFRASHIPCWSYFRVTVRSRDLPQGPSRHPETITASRPAVAK